MTKEMLINVSEGEECRIALLEDGKLEELYMERTSSTSHVGNIYKGRVTNVEASIQAAFIDFGLGRNGFLHISDLMPTYFGRRGDEIVETVGKKMARRDRPPIQRCLRRGDEIVVQIIKEGIGTKGPTLSTYLSIPGRFLVMMPGMGKMGVSRKIEDDAERRRLRQILDQLEPPEDVGFIIRTAGVGRSKVEIERDLKYLVRLWDNLKKKRDGGPGPVELYTEGDLVTRTVRDMFSTDVDTIIVDNKEVAKRVKEVIKLSNPRARNKVELYEDPIPLFHKFGIEREIELMYSRHVPLPSGGSLVIDSTEAIVAIDVNSGKFRDHSDAETTAFKTDMEAAEEIPRQLRLRDLGGVIICDFIDLRFERHRRELEKKLHDNFKKDRAKSKILRMSQFGIIEMTRQRMRPSLKRSIYFDCPHCKGAGLVKTPESMSLDVMRRLAIAINDSRVVRVELTVCSEVSFYLQNRKRVGLAELERQYNKRIVIHSDPRGGLDEMKLELFDARDGLVVVEELEQALRPQPHRTQLTTRPHPHQQPSRHDRRQQTEQTRRPPQGGRGQDDWRRREEETLDEAEEFERDEAVDELDSRGRDDDRRERQPVGRRDDRDDRDAEAEHDEGPIDEESSELADEEPREEVEARDEEADDRNRRPAPQGRDNRRDFGGGRRDESRRDFNRRDEPQRNDNRRSEQRQGGRDDRGRPHQQGQNRFPQNQPRGDRDDRGFDPNRQRSDPRDPRQRGQERAPAGQDRGPQNGQGGYGQPGGEMQEEGGRRRRRRRRRRGRGRGGQQQGQPMEAGQGGPLEGEPPDHDDTETGYDEGLPPEAEHQEEEREAVFEAGGEEVFEYERHEPEEGRSTLEDRREEPLEEAEERVERYVEEPSIEADASGRILSETVERSVYERVEDTAAEAAPEAAESPAAEAPRAAPAEAPEPATEEKPKRRRRGTASTAQKTPRKTAAKTGTRAPRRKRGAAAAEPEAAPAAPSEAETPAATEEPAPTAETPAEEPPRRGRSRSTDRHLMPEEEPDEPLRPSPSRRPRSSRDLDDIPEDLF